MREKLEEQLDRYLEIEKLMQDPEILSDGARYSLLARERGGLARIAQKYREFKEFNQQIAETREMAEEEADAEMREMALEELPGLNEKREKSWNELLDLTAGGDEANRTKCMLEIRGGTGGDEAALFARDLYDMYTKYAIRHGWKMEVLDMSPTELGGFKEVIVGVEGEGCFRQLQYESGGHRVQRVPETETKGRIQTSMATVAVLPEPEDVEIELKPDDYRVDKFCASGPGGQHVNKTASAIRLTHFATNVVVQCQDEKSQHKNLAKALRVLKNRLYELKQAEVHEKRANERKTLVGSGDRNERIRTYNFPENRVSDHRINFTIYKLDQILAGNCDLVVNELIEYDRQQYRAAIGVLD